MGLWCRLNELIQPDMLSPVPGTRIIATDQHDLFSCRATVVIIGQARDGRLRSTWPVRSC